MWKYMAGWMLIFIASISYGQIDITWDEIPQEVGVHMIYEICDTVVIDLGTPGGGKTWNFTSQVTDGYLEEWIVDGAGTPFIDSFPTANLVYKSLDAADTNYIYSKLTPDAKTHLGFGFIRPDTTLVGIGTDPWTIPLPINYGDSWSIYANFDATIDTLTTVRVGMRGRHHVDAWGTVNIPYGSFGCLRIQQYDTMYVTVYFRGMPVYGDTTYHIDYLFIAENHGTIVYVTSYDGETDPNYTQASSISRLSSFTGVSEAHLIQDFEVSRFPNPFVKTTKISYTLPEDGYVKLEVFNLMGGKIKTLVDGFQTKGEKVVKWDASELPAGIYLYRIETPLGIKTDKMILLR